MQPAEIHYLRDIPILFAKGIIAIKERNLLLIIQALMLIVVIPVYILTFIFSWKYEAHKTNAKYDPKLVGSYFAEVLWWGIPCILIIIIGWITWLGTEELDPFKPIESDKKPVRIQVVALQWKWLFIYPEENIATVNFFQFPEKTPVSFEITSDAPMNSFWIPQLAGQIYAMPNMKTKLHMMADKKGDFRGASANLSGVGFAGMHFIAKSSSQEDFDKWVEQVKEADKKLDFASYADLAKPSRNDPVAKYELMDEELFDKILMKNAPKG